jgi:hypothetical protein
MTEMVGTDPLLSPVREYDLSGLLPQLPEPPANVNLDTNLANTQQQRRLTGFAINGVTPGSAQERFMKWYVYSYSHPQRWGREYRSVLPVGPGGTSSPPVGQIIMRWTAAGHCTASLIAEGPVTIVSSRTAEDLTTLLQQYFGISQVIGQGKDWTAAELRTVVTALLLMPAEDRAALDGVVLVRMPQVEAAEANTHALFHLHQEFSVQPLAVTDIAELKVGDGTFSNDDRVFVGTGPAKRWPVSCQKILHEAGHAVELAAYRRKMSAKLNASLELNRAAAAARAAGQAVTEAQTTRYQQAKARYDQAVAELAATKGPTGRTIPLEAFVAHVTARNINRRLTGYAGDNWPANPSELYAEAYSLWRLDPQFLAEFSADLASFFTAGTYRPAG